MTKRVADHKVHKIIINRWSPRVMSGETITDEELFSLFEAARWAPSSYNNQPWHLIYAKRDTEHWQKLYDLMVSFNQMWSKNAAVLVVILSRIPFEKTGEPSRTHTFDTGAAWENLALQACVNGLVVHGMEGFDYDKAKTALSIPEQYEVEAMCAIGKPGKKEDLSPEMQEREAPSPRKKVEEIISEGVFKK